MSDEIDLSGVDPFDVEAAALQVMLNHELPKQLRNLGIDPNPVSVVVGDPLLN